MAVLIAGPTASGKSRIALELAERHGGVVINSDAMQVYRDLCVLTARPSPADEARVPHRLYGHVDAANAYSVGAFLDDARAAIDEARAAGALPILVGGTGLYFAALTEGLAPIPPVDETVREKWREAARIRPASELHDHLATLDPAMAARLRPTDPQRIVRALEVMEATGRSLADWQEDRGPPALPLGPHVVAIRLTPDRAALREAIAARFRAMVNEGAVEEAAALTARQLDPTLPAMKAIGVAPLAAFARGEITEDAAVAEAVTATRQYAKRQDTWMRGRFAHWRAADPADARAVLDAAVPR